MPRTEDGGSSPAGAASASLLIRLRGIKPSLSPAEDRVADIVLADARACRGPDHQRARHGGAHVRDDGAALLPPARAAGLPAAASRAGRGVGAPPRTMSRNGTDISAERHHRRHHRQGRLRRRERRRGDRPAARPRHPRLRRGAIAEAGRVDIYGIGASAIVGTRPAAEAAPHRHRRVRVERPAHRPDERHPARPRRRRHRHLALGHHHRDDRGARGGPLDRGATTIAITNFPLSRLASRRRLPAHHGGARDQPPLGRDREPHRGPHRRRLPLHRGRPAQPAPGPQGRRRDPGGRRRPPRHDDGAGVATGVDVTHSQH